MTTSAVQRERDASERPTDSSRQQHPGGWPGRRPPAWVSVLGAAVALPAALYMILRPENYGLTPNNLDPVFYTGYASNLDDLMAALGDGRYFVSRWSAYLPAYVATELAGPIHGRLLLRLVLASAMLLVVWDLGRRRGRSVAQQFLIGTLVLTMPIFVRAYFSDYVEYLVVAVGVLLVGVCLRPSQSRRLAFLIGALAALVLVANPAAIGMVGLSVATGLWLGVRSWRERAIHALVSLGAFIAVGLAGLVFFRAKYGIENVYQPTIDFMRTYEAPENDPWRSPQLKWLGEFTWLYVVPILVIGALVVARARSITFDRIEKAALVLCSLEYATHWYDQFIRGGLTLEMSLYWSFVYPTFAVTLVLVVGRLTDGMRSEIVAGLGVAWIVLMFVGVPESLLLPAALGFALLAVVLAAAAALLARRVPWATVLLMVGLLGWVQIGAPRYVPTPDTQVNSSPYYDRVFRNGGSESEKILAETVWFEKQMDRVPGDAYAAFVVAGGWASPIVGVYAPHVTGRLVPLDPARERLTEQAVHEIKSGVRPVLAVYGPPADVERVVATFPADLGIGTMILDETHRRALGYRLVVYTMPDEQRVPFEWKADLLRIQSGRLVGTTAVARPGDVPGVVTFGPYIPLRPGRYTATIRYSSTEPTGTPVGVFDVSSTATGVVASSALEGTGGTTREVTVEFAPTNAAAKYEFRSQWNGAGTLTVESVAYDRA